MNLLSKTECENFSIESIPPLSKSTTSQLHINVFILIYDKL